MDVSIIETSGLGDRSYLVMTAVNRRQVRPAPAPGHQQLSPGSAGSACSDVAGGS